MSCYSEKAICITIDTYEYVSENDQLLSVRVAMLSWNSCCVNVGGLTVPRSSVGGSFMVNCTIRPYYLAHCLCELHQQ